MSKDTLYSHTVHGFGIALNVDMTDNRDILSSRIFHPILAVFFLADTLICNSHRLPRSVLHHVQTTDD
jgi:hypothetical protein